MKSDTQFHRTTPNAARNRAASTLPQSSNTPSTLIFRVGALLTAAALSACGGGGGGSASSIAAAASDTAQTLASITVGGGIKNSTPTVLTPVTPVTVAPVAPVVASTVLTDVRIQNTGAAQTSVPFTFGQVFAAGALMPTEGLAAKLADGTVQRLQVNVKATHADGSVRHAIISGVLPTLAANATQKLDLAKSSVSDVSTVSPQGLTAAGLTSVVTITVNNVKYTASLADALASPNPTAWLAGSIANEWFFNAPLKNAAGAVHPLLTARFGVRWYSGLSKQARVEVIVENNKTFSAPASNFTYDVNVDVAGRSVYAKTGLTHYHHARWHQYAWWDATRQPAINIQHNTAYLIASKAVSNYDQSVTIPESTLSAISGALSAKNTGPMTIGTVMAGMGNAGGRGDIGPLPDWSVNYLLSMDKRAKDLMLINADGSGSWSMHYRDENTDYPIRTDSEANKRISTHGNLSSTGPLPVPRCAGAGACDQIFVHDVAHLPSLTYLPYLVTGDYFYLEELQFWAASDPLETDPSNNGYGQGLMRWHQIRGQAWAMRTLGEAAYVTPDASPMKAYFAKQLDNNLNFYTQTYVVGNPNNLGAYDGSGELSFFPVDNQTNIQGSSPWQDAFFTWSFGYLTELGFEKARPVFEWKSKFATGRLTDPGYCYVMSTAYALGNLRDGVNGKVYGSFAELYKANFGGAIIPNDGYEFKPGPLGVKFSDLPCGSQAQADYLGFINGFGWPAGRFIGYSDSVLGYPANIQPAVALSATLNAPNGRKAWDVFDKRLLKANYSNDPQWDIIPR